jgi:hypothetical protein
MRSLLGALVAHTTVCAMFILAADASLLTARETGHTGGLGHYATVTTVPGFSKVEGAMIPRFCQAKTVVQVGSTAAVSEVIKQANYKCKGKRLSIRATRNLYHSSSDILCPYTDTDCSYVLDTEPMNKVSVGGKNSFISFSPVPLKGV